MNQAQALEIRKLARHLQRQMVLRNEAEIDSVTKWLDGLSGTYGSEMRRGVLSVLLADCVDGLVKVLGTADAVVAGLDKVDEIEALNYRVLGEDDTPTKGATHA